MRLLLLLMTTAVLAAGVAAQEVTSIPLLEEFRAAVREWIADANIVIVEYESRGEGAAYTTIGLDPHTGAWFSASGTQYSGRTTEGVCYVSDGQTQEVISNYAAYDKVGASPYSLIPMALPIAVLHSSRGLVGIERTHEQNWSISFEGFGPDPARLPVVTVEISPTGVPICVSSEEISGAAGREASRRVFEFEEQSPLRLMIAKRAPTASGPHPFVLTNVAEFQGQRPDLFGMETVRALASDNRAKMRMRLNEIAVSRNDEKGSGSPREAPYVASGWGRYSWSLIAAGGAVVAIGLLAWLRARASR